MSATGFQPDPSAKAPWTRTTFFTAPKLIVANETPSTTERVNVKIVFM
jgi:hypothetical protein